MRGAGRFLIANVAVWIVMTAILVIVPDQLERWMALDVARPCGWVVAFSVWVVLVEDQWKARFSPVPRFMLQLVLWVGAVLAATWVSDLFRI